MEHTTKRLCVKQINKQFNQFRSSACFVFLIYKLVRSTVRNVQLVVESKTGLKDHHPIIIRLVKKWLERSQRLIIIRPTATSTHPFSADLKAGRVTADGAPGRTITHPSVIKRKAFENAFKKIICNLLVSALSVSLLQLSEIICLPVCDISPLCLNSQPSSRLSCLDRPFHKPR